MHFCWSTLLLTAACLMTSPLVAQSDEEEEGIEIGSDAERVVGSPQKRRAFLLKAQASKTGEFIEFEPPELRFGCVPYYSLDEEAYHDLMQLGVDSETTIAARILWNNYSRRFASDVIKFASEGKDADTKRLRATIEDDLRPANVEKLLKEGNYAWAAWLAFLRPNERLVPALIAGLKDQPDYVPETLLALGASRDKRAFEPLIGIVSGKNVRMRGNAASALGRLGLVEAESHLLKALDSESGWVQVNAASALAKVGTKASLPALQKHADSDRYTGALGVKRVSVDAIKQINARH
jgi:hypothetical protein